jgi:hypothetical protein
MTQQCPALSAVFLPLFPYIWSWCLLISRREGKDRQQSALAQVLASSLISFKLLLNSLTH